VYPYLLKGLTTDRPAQRGGGTDLPYIPMHRGWGNLVAIDCRGDWFSRCVLSRALSNPLDASFCVPARPRALADGPPEIFNTDQGRRFPSEAFTGVLKEAGISDQHGGPGSSP
jgi:putative transposase